MFILFILGILLGGVAVIFALQNVTITTVTFFYWQFHSSLAVILLMAVFSGIVATLLILLPQNIEGYFNYRHLKKENEKLAEELRKQKELTVFAKNNPPTAEAIAKIEHEVIAEDHSL